MRSLEFLGAWSSPKGTQNSNLGQPRVFRIQCGDLVYKDSIHLPMYPSASILFICPVTYPSICHYIPIHPSVISPCNTVIYWCIHVSIIYISIIHYLSINHRLSISSQPAIYHLSINKLFWPSIFLTVAYYLPTYLPSIYSSLTYFPFIAPLSFQSPIHHISPTFHLPTQSSTHLLSAIQLATSYFWFLTCLSTYLSVHLSCISTYREVMIKPGFVASFIIPALRKQR